MRRFNRSMLLLCAVAGLAGCDTDDRLYPDVLLRDPEPVVLDDAIFMLSHASGSVIRVIPGPQGEPYTDQKEAEIDAFRLGEGLQHLVATPDGARLLVLNHERAQHYLALLDPKADCDGATALEDGCVEQLEARELHDQLVISPDSRYVISYISEASIDGSSANLINLNELGIYDLQERTVRFVTLSFNPREFAFLKNPADPRVVVLTDKQVITVNLATGEDVSRELTLGSDSSLTPYRVSITGDDRFALVTIVGSSDLYTFDLTQPTLPINILSLSGAPVSMARSASGEETLVLTNGGTTLDVVRHSDFHVDVHSLKGFANRIVIPEAGSFALLYDGNGLEDYLHHVDLDADRVKAYLLDNPCRDVRLSPDGAAAVIFYTPDYNGYGGGLDSSYAVAILNLAQGDTRPNPILVANLPIDAAFVPGATPAEDEVFVPFSIATGSVVARFNLSTYDSMAVELPPAPGEVGVLSDGRVVVVHDSALGMVSIMPHGAPDQVQFISGFMPAKLF